MKKAEFNYLADYFATFYWKTQVTKEKHTVEKPKLQKCLYFLDEENVVIYLSM